MICPLFFIYVIYQFKTINLGDSDKENKATLNSQNVIVKKKKLNSHADLKHRKKDNECNNKFLAFVFDRTSAHMPQCPYSVSFLYAAAPIYLSLLSCLRKSTHGVPTLRGAQ